MVVAEASENTSRLQMLDFCIETEDGRFDSIQRGVTATITEDGLTAYRSDSIYFYEAKQLQVIITGARWLRKDMEKIKIDLTTGKADALPEGVTLVPMDSENSMSPCMLHVHRDWDVGQHIMLDMDYYDAEGNKCQAPVAARNCSEHGSNCWYEWLDLRDYPHDYIEIQLTYTDSWKAENPVSIDIR